MIDPRPYTYEYRKPRLNNPTYRSSNMYDSLYHLRFSSNSQFILPRQRNLIQQPKDVAQYKSVQKKDYNPQRYEPRQSEIQRQSSHTRQHSLDSREIYQNDKNIKNSSLNKDIRDKVDSKLQDYRQNIGVNSQLSNYGENLMKSSQFNRFSVYEKQQKGFNIINLQPKQMANSLRNFPKFTLEAKLIENGKYNPM